MERGMTTRDEAQTVQLGVRMKEPLRAALEDAAKRHGISMNQEAVRRLERSFDPSVLGPVGVTMDLYGIIISLYRQFMLNAAKRLEEAGQRTDDLVSVEQFDRLQAALESTKQVVDAAISREQRP
jgi:hypothetical protein